MNPGFGVVFNPDGPRSYEGGNGSSGEFNPCGYTSFMRYQAAGDPNDPTTRQTYASYFFYPGAPISGPGLGNGTTNNYPFDVWWDLWTIQETQFGTGDPCADTTNMPTNGLFLSTGMFQPLDPDNPNALGFYKVWLFQRDMANSIFEPYNTGAGDGRNIEGVNFWNYQRRGDQSIQVPVFDLSYPLPLDPRNY